MLLWKPCYHGNNNIHQKLCILKSDEVHIWYICSFIGQQKFINDLVAMETLLPWQQENPSVILYSEVIFGTFVHKGKKNP